MQSFSKCSILEDVGSSAKSSFSTTPFPPSDSVIRQKEWSAACFSSSQGLRKAKSTTSPAGVNAGFLVALQCPALPLSPPFISCDCTRSVPAIKYKGTKQLNVLNLGANNKLFAGEHWSVMLPIADIFPCSSPRGRRSRYIPCRVLKVLHPLSAVGPTCTAHQHIPGLTWGEPLENGWR